MSSHFGFEEAQVLGGEAVHIEGEDILYRVLRFIPVGGLFPLFQGIGKVSNGHDILRRLGEAG